MEWEDGLKAPLPHVLSRLGQRRKDLLGLDSLTVNAALDGQLLFLFSFILNCFFCTALLVRWLLEDTISSAYAANNTFTFTSSL